jgi:hypothetical protein
MLSIEIPEKEFFDESKEEFILIKRATLNLEHSLVSISKWEAKWHIPFFESETTPEQAIDYIRCMTLNREIREDSLIYQSLTLKDVEKINEYISDPMTATTIKEVGGSRNKPQIVTSELIYYWMINFNIPSSFEKWHINRLIMLIRVCSEENKPKKKMTQREIMAQNKALNAARKAKLNVKG